MRRNASNERAESSRGLLSSTCQDIIPQLHWQSCHFGCLNVPDLGYCVIQEMLALCPRSMFRFDGAFARICSIRTYRHEDIPSRLFFRGKPPMSTAQRCVLRISWLILDLLWSYPPPSIMTSRKPIITHFQPGKIKTLRITLYLFSNPGPYLARHVLLRKCHRLSIESLKTVTLAPTETKAKQKFIFYSDRYLNVMKIVFSGALATASKKMLVKYQSSSKAIS